MDTITERFALLALDNKERTLTEAADLRLGHGLCGALLLDLVWQGAIAACEDGIWRRESPAPLPPHLQEAYGVFPERSPLSHGEALRQLYERVATIKSMLLDRLVEKGTVKESTEKLKWSFAMKEYRLKSGKAGYGKWLAEEMAQGRLGLADFWVLELAHAVSLLGGKNVPPAEAISTLSMANEQAGLLSRLIGGRLPEGIAQLGSAAEGARGSTWEWRGFWQEKGASLIEVADIYRGTLENMSYSELKDEYLLVRGLPQNIKLRKRALEVKRPLSVRDGYTEFSPKESYAFPLAKATVAAIFPELGEPQKAGSLKALQDVLARGGFESQRVKVTKKRLQARLKSQVRVEFCHLAAHGSKFLSVCVEGPDYGLTHAHSLNFRVAGVQVMGYVEFLKQGLWERV